MAELPPPPPPNNHGAQAWAPKPKKNVAISPRPMWPPPHPCQRPQDRPFNPPLLSSSGMQILISLTPPRTILLPTANGYEPFLVGMGPYGYQYLFKPIGPPLPLGPLHLPVPQPQLLPHPCPRPQPQVYRNRATVDAQGHGTGVFFPPAQPQIPITNTNNNNTSNRGSRNKQVAEASTHQTWQPQDTNASNENDDVVKQEEEQQTTPSPEISLPKEWTY